ncbi:unnamed protein product [Adineta ricciae]|uniref:OTU domain-containing protein n=1 Tax=Adineta ricciae TaxID=249248 RepID=A0A814ZS11_ADIRI|nr:unnamed protein product [Adineta ricciae]
MSCNIDNTIDTDHSNAMEVDNKFAFDHHETVDDNEQIDLGMSLQLEDLSFNETSDMMEIEESCSSENFEIIDSGPRKILDSFLLEFNFDNTIETNQFVSQVRIISDLIKKSPFITMQNKDNSVRLETRVEYPVRAFDSVYTRTRTTGDGNCLYSSLSILNVGSEKLTHSMRLLAVNTMTTNRDFFQRLCSILGYTFEEQLQRRTATHTIRGGVQIQALSIALSHPIYSYIKFNSNPDPKNTQFIPSNISLQEQIHRFNEGTAGGHLIYLGCESDRNKTGFCLYYNENPGNSCFGSDEIRSDPRPSESNAISSPGFHRIRRIPVGSDKILYWIRWDPSMGLFDLGRTSVGPKGQLRSALKDEIMPMA